MDTNVFVVNNTVHVRFAYSGAAFCDMALTPEQAADLSLKLVQSLDKHYSFPICRSR